MSRKVIEAYGRKWELTHQTIEYDVYQPTLNEGEETIPCLGFELYQKREEEVKDGTC